MTQKESEQPSGKPARTAAASAPELPHEIAKQFGLHHEADDKVAAEKGQATAEPAPPDTDALIEDPKTDAAVDDILTKEGDDLLAVQDGQQAHTPVPKRSFGAKVKHFFASWWRNKWARYGTILVALAVIGVLAAIPRARYAVLNTAGIRSSAPVVVLDNTTQLPLKNVTVTLGGKKTQTNIKGVASFKDLKLGDYRLTVRRLAFAPQERAVTIGWGSNPLGTFKLRATGIQYTLTVKDYLSGKPITGAEAASDAFNALSDKNGKIILTMEETDVTTLSVVLSAAGYRTETIALDALAATTADARLVPAQKALYVSRQSGTYDVYSSDLDGKNKKVLLTGTGAENSNISLAVSPDNQRAALVSTRDNRRDADGFLLFALTIIDVRTGTAVAVDHAQQIQLIDWVGDRLIYRSTIAGASAADPQRSRLISFNYDSNARIQLATANQFNAILSARGNVYYAVSSSDPEASLGLFRIKADGSNRKRLSEQEVWTGLRTTYGGLSLQTPEGWYSYSLDSDQLSKSSAPTALTSYAFANDTTSKYSLWTDVRDGKGALLRYDTAGDTNTTLAARDGLTVPIRWAGDNAIIYRVVTATESADYVVSPEGGQSYKLADVTATRGLSY